MWTACVRGGRRSAQQGCKDSQARPGEQEFQLSPPAQTAGRAPPVRKAGRNQTKAAPAPSEMRYSDFLAFATQRVPEEDSPWFGHIAIKLETDSTAPKRTNSRGSGVSDQKTRDRASRLRAGDLNQSSVRRGNHRGHGRSLAWPGETPWTEVFTIIREEIVSPERSHSGVKAEAESAAETLAAKAKIFRERTYK